MHHENNQKKFSPLVERLMPNATLEEKEIAERNVHNFLEVMYRIYERFEREERFPLPPIEDGLYWKSPNMPPRQDE